MTPPFLRYCWVCLVVVVATFQTDAQTISGVVNSYHKVTSISIPSNSVTVSNVAGLNVGDKVLLIQMKGAAIDGGNSANFGNISSVGSAGNYEFNYVCGISSNELLLQRELIRTYDMAGLVQVVRVATYNSVTISDTIKAAPWDPVAGTGGIVAIEADDTIYLNSSIQVSGMGFLGGPLLNYPSPAYDCSWATNVTGYFLSVPPTPSISYTGGWKGEGIAAYIASKEYGRGKQANGGGGGNNHNTGGGGGANYGAGGLGGRRSNESSFACHGTNPGIGGLALSSLGYSAGNNKIFLGGGGGSGHENNDRGMGGGNGGGIIILKADVIVSGSQYLLANGVAPVNPVNADPLVAEGDGGGGGGGGGVIIIDAPQISGTILAEAKGGRGSDASNLVNDCTGPGGGGGGGVVWASGGSFPAAVSATVNGESNGFISMNSSIVACRGSANGSTPGNNGATLTGYSEPLGPSMICTILPTPDLLKFDGLATEKGNTIAWTMAEGSRGDYFVLERAFFDGSFQAIQKVDNTGKRNFQYFDAVAVGECFYRLKIVYSGSYSYSSVLSVTRPAKKSSLFARYHEGKLQVQLHSERQSRLSADIYTTTGEIVASTEISLAVGQNSFSMLTGSLPSGLYYLKVGHLTHRFFVVK